MNGDDRGRGAEWPIDRRRDRIDTAAAAPAGPRTNSERIIETRRGGVNPIYIILGGLVLLLLLAWLLLGRTNSNQDKLTASATENSAATADPEKRCASNQTYDVIKRDLFRRAAQLRGSDQAAFDRLSAYASLRMENPVMESQDESSGAVNCTGSISLDFPPGVAVVGGRRTLSADIDYSVRSAADGSGTVVMLRNADAIVTPLATLARTGQAPSAPATQAPAPALPAGGSVPQQSGASPAPAAPEAPAAPQAPAAPEPLRETAGARPSFNCANARTRGEVAVCSDAGLASLDRQMAAQFGTAIRAASPEQRSLLQQTRSRFLAYRDRCRSDGCIADAYRGRMREIRDIMEGRWRPR